MPLPPVLSPAVRTYPPGGGASGRTLAVVLACLALATLAPTPLAAAKVESISDRASLRLLHADGDTLFEAGRASGDLPGTLHVTLTLRTASARSSFTIRAHGGTISGRGTGKLKIGKGGYDSFGGRVEVTGGTGIFHGASGTAGLYGTIYRITDQIKLQVKGKLHF